MQVFLKQTSIQRQTDHLADNPHPTFDGFGNPLIIQSQNNQIGLMGQSQGQNFVNPRLFTTERIDHRPFFDHAQSRCKSCRIGAVQTKR